MFKHGSDKQPPAKIRWAIQILTTEYLIDGYMDEAREGLKNWDWFFSEDVFAVDPLTSVQVQPTGHLAAPLQSFSIWHMAWRTTVVAVIPRDEAGLQVVRKASSKYTHSFPVVLYAGPYIMRGALMGESADLELELQGGAASLILTDVTVECQVPGTKLAALTAPWLFVNIRWVHGFSPA